MLAFGAVPMMRLISANFSRMWYPVAGRPAHCPEVFGMHHGCMTLRTFPGIKSRWVSPLHEACAWLVSRLGSVGLGYELVDDVLACRRLRFARYTLF